MSHTATSSNRSPSSDRYGRCITCEISPQPTTPIRIRPAAIRALWCSEASGSAHVHDLWTPGATVAVAMRVRGAARAPRHPGRRAARPAAARGPRSRAVALPRLHPRRRGDRDRADARRGHDAADRRGRGAARRLGQARLPVPDAVVQGPGSGGPGRPRRCSGTPARSWPIPAATPAARSRRTRRGRGCPARCSSPSTPRRASSARYAPTARRWSSCRATAPRRPRRRSTPSAPPARCTPRTSTTRTSSRAPRHTRSSCGSSSTRAPMR